MEKKSFNYRILMLTTLIISGCSIIYEVLISAVSSYLVGDSVKQFSITIGLYMCAMGIGSYISKYIKDKLFSGAVIIAESHLTIHTWPEHAYAAVDLFTCGDIDYEAGLNTLKVFLESKRCEVKKMFRGEFSKVKISE